MDTLALNLASKPEVGIKWLWNKVQGSEGRTENREGEGSASLQESHSSPKPTEPRFPHLSGEVQVRMSHI